MKVLFLGAHCDDIELGCGATLHKHKKDWDVTAAILGSSDISKNTLHWKSPQNDAAAIEKATVIALNYLGVSQIIRKDFKSCFFRESRNEIWQFLSGLEKTIKPDLVFSQHADSHQDHETLYLETLRNFRATPVLFYRPHQRDSTPFTPNTFSVVSETNVQMKNTALDFYRVTIQERPYFRPENIIAEMRVHGMKIEQTYAEAFIATRNYI